jgi:putative flavoprotein involved in K+ transport
MITQPQPEQHGTIVIGAGQAGLSVGYYLAQRRLPFIILDANPRIGDTWRNRWDSLHLFTPARFDGLAGMPFPAQPQSFPAKDAMADYLEAYAARFDLPVRGGMPVDRLSRRGHKYLVTAGGREFEADHVVVAMARYQRPQVPAFAAQLNPQIRQMHSSAYRNPGQLKDGGVLIVGAGNSGAEIALDIARNHLSIDHVSDDHRPIWLSGRHPGHIPFRIGGLAARLFLQRFVLRFLFHRVLTNRTPMGRKMREGVLTRGGPLIRVKPEDLAAAGIQRAPKVSGTQAGLPLLEDGRVLEVANVIWCTGFHPGFSWIDLPVFEEDGVPKHESGIVLGEPGLYFIGLPFIYAFSSTMVHGAARDAERIARVIDTRTRAARATSRPQETAEVTASIAG